MSEKYDSKKKYGKRKNTARSASVCVISTTGVVKRIKRDKADELVNDGDWNYTSKSIWKEYNRK